MSVGRAGAPVVLELSEYGTLTTDALTPAQRARLQSDFGHAIQVAPSWLAGHTELTAGDFVGVIALDGLQLHIRPKVPLSNLFYMLTYAYDLAQFRNSPTTLAESDDLFAFLVEIFVKQVDRLVRDGIARGYVASDDDPAYLRGRLRPMEHLRRSATRPGRFPQEVNEFTADLLTNRILKFTLWQLARAGAGTDTARRGLRRTLSAFSEVSLVAITPADCQRVVYTRLNEAYRTPINLARLFLQHLSLEGHAGAAPFMSYLVPMPRVFELFVGRYLQETYANHPRLSVALQETIWLDEAQWAQGRLDIMLRRDGRPWLILDTKYKRFGGKPSADDRQQMYTYCGTMGIDRALLVYADAWAGTYREVLKHAQVPVVLTAQSLALDGALGDFRARCAVWAAGFGSGM